MNQELIDRCADEIEGRKLRYPETLQLVRDCREALLEVATLRQQAERSGVAVSDEVVKVAYDTFCNTQTCGYDNDTDMKLMRRVVEAVAPLLRTAPAEQGGRVEFTEEHGKALRDLKVGEVLTPEQWEAVCQFVRDQEVIIDDLQAALAQNTQVDGEPVGIIEGIDEETNTVTVDWRGPISCGDELFTRHVERARVPDGWVLVPREMTEKMRRAGWDEENNGITSVWKALLAAAPSQPAQDAGGGLGIPSCGKPLCSEGDHHPLCTTQPKDAGHE